jgi:transmembrane sensor
MNQEIFRHLLNQYVAGELSADDKASLIELLDQPGNEDALDSFVMDVMLSDDPEKIEDPAIQASIHAYLDKHMGGIPAATPVISMPVLRRNKIWLAAATIVLLAGTAAFFLFSGRSSKTIDKIGNVAQRYKNDLPPGTRGAILTLDNGKQIVLDSAGNGMLAVLGKTKVINGNGQITYAGNGKSSQEPKYQEPEYNTMTTPKGRQYQLVLADGSKVWLNAASSIRFPTAFTGKERKVEISGEAYFEIATSTDEGGHEKMPFLVHIDPPFGGTGMDIQVLGTHFNVNAYGEEATVQTTLLEGAVKISGGGGERLLRPGQQGRFGQAGNFEVMNDVNVDVVMGWKNGYFSFQHTDLPTVMQQIARWYDVDIAYAGKIPDRRFGGEISRNSNASQVLRILEESKVYFRIEGKKIIVLAD